MNMKKLMTAAEAAGYAMAPDEEFFHSSDDLAMDQLDLAIEPVEFEAAQGAVASHGLVARTTVAEAWLKDVFGGYLGRRLPA